MKFRLPFKVFIIIILPFIFGFIQMQSNVKNSYTDELRKIAIEEKAVVEEQLNEIENYFISSKIKTFSDIPASSIAEIEAIMLTVRKLIKQVAYDIDKSDNELNATITVDSHGLTYLPSYYELSDQEKIQINQQLNNISIRSVQLAIQLLASVNKNLMSQAISAKGEEKKNLYITQAALVYEMADMVLVILDEISLEGKDEILKVKAETERRINTRISDLQGDLDGIDQLQKEGKISITFAENLISSNLGLIKANKLAIEGWDALGAGLNDQSNWLNSQKEKRYSIELKKTQAKRQLETIIDLTVLGEFQSIIGSMEELMEEVQDIELLILTPEEVMALLNLEYTSSDK